MSYWVDKIDTLIRQQNLLEFTCSFESIPAMRLADFGSRDIAIEIYSEVLGCKLWLCSNDKMAEKIEKEAPGQVCYIAEELRHLISHRPSHESLRMIHEVKVTNSGSSIKTYAPKDPRPQF